jgi:hypothetical protein
MGMTISVVASALTESFRHQYRPLVLNSMRY